MHHFYAIYGADARCRRPRNFIDVDYLNDEDDDDNDATTTTMLCQTLCLYGPCRPRLEEARSGFQIPVVQPPPGDDGAVILGR